MDVTEAFDSEIGIKPYSNIATLHELLSKFSRNQGVKYKVANSLRYNEGDPRKATLGYAMAVFACVLKRTHQCPSYFRVEVRKGLLQVVDRVMEHNHCRIAGDPEPVVDLTEQFNAHFKNAKLMSFNAVMAKVKAFEEITGSEFRVGRSDLFKPGDPEREQYRYRRITYECIHFGQRKSVARLMSDLNGSASSWSRTSRLGCMAKFDVRYSTQGFKISAVVMKHNHKVSPLGLGCSTVGRLSRRKSTQYHQRRCLNDEREVCENGESVEDNHSHAGENEEEQSVTPAKIPREMSPPPPPLSSPPAAESARFSIPRFAVGTHRPPQPYWMKNPATLLKKTLPSERSKKTKDEGGVEMLPPKLNDLSQSERHLLLSGKMHRVLDKACHGDVKRFRECNEMLDKLEQSWAREDTLI
ncbi:hypothetical protein Aperf_G00000100804 [Anoplocephala perfoliata]